MRTPARSNKRAAQSGALQGPARAHASTHARTYARTRTAPRRLGSGNLKHEDDVAPVPMSADVRSTYLANTTVMGFEQVGKAACCAVAPSNCCRGETWILKGPRIIRYQRFKVPWYFPAQHLIYPAWLDSGWEAPICLIQPPKPPSPPLPPPALHLPPGGRHFAHRHQPAV